MRPQLAAIRVRTAKSRKSCLAHGRLGTPDGACRNRMRTMAKESMQSFSRAPTELSLFRHLPTCTTVRLPISARAGTLLFSDRPRRTRFPDFRARGHPTRPAGLSGCLSPRFPRARAPYSSPERDRPVGCRRETGKGRPKRSASLTFRTRSRAAERFSPEIVAVRGVGVAVAGLLLRRCRRPGRRS